MYILLISRGYPSKNDPQWGCFERDQAEALGELGHKVVMASVDRRFRFYWRRIGFTHFVQNNINIYNSFLFPSAIVSLFSKKLDYIFYKYQFNKLYDRIVKDHGTPDVIYSHYLYNTAQSVGLKNRNSTPLVAIEHWSELNADNISLDIKNLGNIAYSDTDEIIAVSKSLSQRIKQHFSKESVIINNMVNESYFSDSVVLRKTDKKNFNFITIGSLISRKDHRLLIYAFHKANFGKNVTLSIVGGGKLKSELQKQIKDLGLQNNVFLLGLKNKEEIRDILSKSDAFVLSSLAENFSVAVLEALSVGLPCIATLCGGTDECISDKSGLLVPIKDTDKLSTAMVQMRNNYAQYDKQAIADDCKAKYSPEVIAKQIESVFNRVIENRKR
ncbi:MAG: glycosyltransferase [bacterium]